MTLSGESLGGQWPGSAGWTQHVSKSNGKLGTADGKLFTSTDIYLVYFFYLVVSQRERLR